MKLHTDCTRFFMGIRHVACTDMSRFLKRQPTGKMYFDTLVKHSCIPENLSWDGDTGKVDTHGFRASFFTSILE